MRLEMNYRGKKRKKHKHIEAKHYLQNKQKITEEIKEEVKKYRSEEHTSEL